MATATVGWIIPTRDDVTGASRKAIERAALAAASIITQRTARGLDARGRLFAPYTEDYAALRLANGRNAGRVDLTSSGTMLRALRVLGVVSGRRAVIGWEGQHVARPLRMPLKPGTPKGNPRTARGVTRVSYRDLVEGLSRKRLFFAIVTRAEQSEVRAEYRRSLLQLLAEVRTTRGAR